MNEVYEKLLKCRDRVRKITDFKPQVAIVLGSGLGDYANNVECVCRIDYHDIDGFPVSTVAGHAGEYVFGYIDKVPVVLMNGRVHYYEGYPMTDVVLPVRLMGLLGAKILFLTNAVGGINPTLNVGDLLLITGHIPSFVPNPLIGPNIDELGVRFPDMSEVYKKDLCDIIRNTAHNENIALREGIYVQTTGPSYESPAEIEMFRKLGADVVGMSTVVEAIAANHMGMRVCGISCVSNKAAGLNEQPLTHEEIKEAADKAAPFFKRLVTESVKNMAL